MYLEYSRFKQLISDFKKQRKRGNAIKIPGFYVFTPHRAFASIRVKQDAETNQYSAQPVGELVPMLSNVDDNYFGDRVNV